MSRVGREITTLPAGVTLTYENNIVTVKGPKGELTQEIKPQVKVNIEGDKVTLTRSDDSRQVKSYHGLYSRLVQNMVEGVSKGFSTKLVFHGVGYKAQMQGANLLLNIGFSHPVVIPTEEGVSISVITQQEAVAAGGNPAAGGIIVSGASKEKVGAMASKIRAVKKVEPYHMYGIRYIDEKVIRKESKSGAKKK